MDKVVLSAKSFPQVYEFLGIDTGRLGCIMLDTQPIVVSDIIPTADLYVQEDAEDYLKGYISEETAHVTLLYGLLRSGQELKNHVDMVLAGWSAESVTIEKVGFFYGEDENGTQFITVVAFIEPDVNLLEGNARIRLLPHIDTFPEYHPHITLAYVKDSAEWNEHIAVLNERYAGKKVPVVRLNYGK